MTPSTGVGLNGVSCPGTDCVAVGENSSISALAESWDGSAWSDMHAPPAGKVGSAFRGVSCLTSSDCFAVGFYVKSRVFAPLAERLQGSAWVIVAIPDPAGAGVAQLGGVACTSARACWAVGERQKTHSSPARTLAERWNGTRWSIVATP